MAIGPSSPTRPRTPPTRRRSRRSRPGGSPRRFHCSRVSWRATPATPTPTTGSATPCAAPARELAGVRAVLTAADVPATAVIPNRVPAPPGTNRYLQPAIARELVRFVGEPVAMVVADDPYLARDALDLLDAVYEPLPPCASVAAALAPGAPRLFASTDSNNVATIAMRVGDADAALARAAVV